MKLLCCAAALATLFALASFTRAAEETLPRLAYNNPGTLVDLGVGLWAWPLPMDYNGDGLIDLVVVCSDKPYNGTWFFENSGRIDPQTKLPVFQPAVLIGKSAASAGISYVTGKPVVTATASVKNGDVFDFRGNTFPDFKATQFTRPSPLPVPRKIHLEPGNIRQNQWQLVDYDGDGALDVTVGIDFWGDFGPVNGGEGAFNAKGEWTRGTPRGYSYLLRNIGIRVAPKLAAAQTVTLTLPPGTHNPAPAWNWWKPTGNELVSQWRTTPQMVDWNGDGLIDLVMSDPEGYLALCERRRDAAGTLPLLPSQRVFLRKGANIFSINGLRQNKESGLLRLTAGFYGSNGRRTFCIAD